MEEPRHKTSVPEGGRQPPEIQGNTHTGESLRTDTQIIPKQSHHIGGQSHPIADSLGDFKWMAVVLPKNRPKTIIIKTGGKSDF